MLVYSAVVAVVWNRIETSCASPNILIESPKLAGGGAGGFDGLCNAQMHKFLA